MINPQRLSLILVICFSFVGSLLAGTYDSLTSTTTDLTSITERETVRRQEGVERAKVSLEAAETAMSKGDCELAFAQYRVAADLLPHVKPLARWRREALEGLCESAICLAEKRIVEGRFGDAEAILKLVLEPQYNPRCEEAIEMLAHLEDPDYYNRTITPTFARKVDETKQLLLEGTQFFDTGRYDLAIKRADQVLNLDPYNIAARKLQEKVNSQKMEYGIDAYNETRARMLTDLDLAWQSPVRRYGLEGGGIIEQRKLQVRTNDAIIAKLDRIIIPELQFRDATIREAIDFLKQRSADLDTAEPDLAQRGVNIVLKLDSASAAGGIPGLDGGSASLADRRITLSLRNVPLREALRYITNLANLKYKVDPYAVSVVPQSEPTDILITKEYRVPPSFISSVPTSAAADTSSSPFGAGASLGGTGSNTSIARRATALAVLEAAGVQFPTGASATFVPSSSRLIVRNTQENLDLVDVLVDSTIGTQPVLVEVESKFVEITQNNLKELSFDTLLGQANIPGGGRETTFFGGGTSGTSPGLNGADFPFPIGGQAPVSAGLRSGNIAISQNAIDSLLFGVTGASSLAPGVFGVSGIFTDPQFQVVIRALNQKKGVDLLSAPRVTTKSGQRAVVEVIRELRFPTEFDPPQIPQEFGTSSGGGSFPVTPTTPTAFETRNTGITLEVEPVVGSDGYTIDMNLVPQVVEFEGFINYGSPIGSSVTNMAGISIPIVLTPNVINQPIFSTRRVTTSVSLIDGQTVVIGGLMREDIQKVEDKVPFFGDIPILGRAFRSQVDQHLKRNLVMFVTAKLLNPAGETLLTLDEEEEVVELIAPPELAPPTLPRPDLYGKGK